MIANGVIAVLTSGPAGPPALGPDAPSGAGRLSVIRLDTLKDGALSDGHVDAVLYPITAATDALHEEVARLRRREDSVPVISYATDGEDDETRLREVSRRLGCAAHIGGPLSADELLETVEREKRLADALEALSRTRDAARRERETVTRMVDIIKNVNTVLEPGRVMDVVMERAQRTLDCEMWCLFLLDEREETLTLERSGQRSVKADTYRIPLGRGIEGKVLETRQPLIINDLPGSDLHDPNFDIQAGLVTRSALALPLISRGRAIGVFKLVNRVPGGRFSAADLSLMSLLMEPAAVALENAILFQRMEELSVTDDLTRLHNIRYLNGFLVRELKRCRRYGFPVSVIFLDMDGFKTVNDRYGHLAGSQTLTEVGQVLRQTVRDIDVVVRYGGDEFVVILPQTDAQGALIIADRIRKRIDKTVFLRGMGLSVHLTASLGVSSFPDIGRTRDELIHKADVAMYESKDGGKNRVTLAR